MLDLRPGNSLPQVSGLGDSVTDPPVECHRPFTPLAPHKPPPTHQTFSPITSHTNTPPSSLPPWVSCPFPKACSTSVIPQITPFPCDPCPSPYPCPMGFLPSFPELLPVCLPPSLWSHCVLGAVHGKGGDISPNSPMSSSAHPCDDVLGSAVHPLEPFCLLWL